jgi:hypothetical protein
MKALPVLAALAISTVAAFAADQQWVTYQGKTGPGAGKHIVFLTGDEEYRSEEGLPQLARILADRHGFKCTVLFSINPQTGAIDPQTKDNEPGDRGSRFRRSLRDAPCVSALGPMSR